MRVLTEKKRADQALVEIVIHAVFAVHADGMVQNIEYEGGKRHN